ncbi:unnamed protein product [Clavelina lepadiformis]|uniref:Uncharacterized protein n=1 Tax=Clavelina lepadiformis TaxID=159417 RepID=A0ABP0F882_CLALP
MNLPLTQREQIRLLKPSRPKAPTEYNLQYKRWPPRPFTYDSFRIVNSSDRKKTPSLKSDLESTCETRFTSSTGYPASSITRTQDQASHSVNTVQSASESEPDVLSKEWFKDYELTSALRAKTAVLHDRPVRQKPVRNNSAKNSGPAKCGQLASTSQEELSKKGQLMETEFSVKLRHLNNSLGKDKQHSVQPSHYREAWTNEDHTTKQQKTSGHKPKQRVRSDPLKMRDLCAVIDHIDGEDWSSDLPADSGCFETLPSEKSIANIRSDSVIDVKPFDMEKQPTSKSSTKPINKDLPRENRRKKSSMLEGIDEASLRKIYGDLSSDDIRRLQRTYKGVVGIAFTL